MSPHPNLLKLNGVEPRDDILFKSEIAANYARFEDKLETTIITEIGKETIERLAASLKMMYWINDTKALMKNPMALSELLELIYREDKESPTLNKIVETIISLVKTDESKNEQSATTKAA